MRFSLISLGLATSLFAGLLAGCPSKPDDSSGGNNTNPDVGNESPIAGAGSDQTVPADQVVNLSGAASTDPEGSPLTYYWSFDAAPAGSTAMSGGTAFTANHSAEAVATSFTPDTIGTYVVSLVVRDDKNLSSHLDYVIIEVTAPESLPVAAAGQDVAVTVGTPATLDGSSSYDPQGKPLTYAWVLNDRPAGSTASISDATVASPSVTPDVKGVYIATLIVSNGLATSAGDSVTVTATTTDNAPVANAGTDITTDDCTTINLSCSGSSDPDGDPLQYFWEVQQRPASSRVDNSTFSDRAAANPTFYPDQAGAYTLSCTVSDGTHWSVPDTVSVVASERATNSPPAVNAGADQAIDAGTAVCEPSGYVWNCDECGDQTLSLGADALTTDADGDPLTYLWEVEEGSAVIAAPNSLLTTVLLENVEPEEAGSCANQSFIFRLTVTDCTGATVSDRVTYQTTCCGVEDTSSR